LRDRGVALLGSDAIQDVQPSGYPNFLQPVHRIGIVHMGLWLIDNCNLEGLQEICLRLGRWAFMLALAPLRIQYGTGSPVNPIAMF
jgi:kynurenine formamidase